IGDVTVTLFDVPPDVMRAATIGGPAVQVVIEQPGQNGTVTFTGRVGQRILVHISGNSTNGVAIQVRDIDRGTTLASAISSASSFGLPTFTIPSTGSYIVVLDPVGPNTGMLNVAVAEK